jgi:hypothetical protein
MTRIEAIRQRAKTRATVRRHTTAIPPIPEDDFAAILSLWDTRETALRALVDKADHLIRDVKADGRMTHELRDVRESLSRLLEQEP